jgi:hypothetical protein
VAAARQNRSQATLGIELLAQLNLYQKYAVFACFQRRYFIVPRPRPPAGEDHEAIHHSNRESAKADSLDAW